MSDFKSFFKILFKGGRGRLSFKIQKFRLHIQYFSNILKIF